MKVRNINGTADTTCLCGSWLAHWKRFSRQSVYFCGAVACSNTDLVGAHVQRGGGSPDRQWYIYPLCERHNHHTGALEVMDDYMLVSANRQETCER